MMNKYDRSGRKCFVLGLTYSCHVILCRLTDRLQLLEWNMTSYVNPSGGPTAARGAPRLSRPTPPLLPPSPRTKCLRREAGVLRRLRRLSQTTQLSNR